MSFSQITKTLHHFWKHGYTYVGHPVCVGATKKRKMDGAQLARQNYIWHTHATPNTTRRFKARNKITHCNESSAAVKVSQYTFAFVWLWQCANKGQLGSLSAATREKQLYTAGKEQFQISLYHDISRPWLLHNQPKAKIDIFLLT